MDLASYLKCFVEYLIARPCVGTAGVGGVRKLTLPISGFDSAVVARRFHFLMQLIVIWLGRLWQS